MFLQKRSLLLLPAHGMAQPLLPLGCGRSTVGHPLPVHAGECSQHLSGVGFLQCRPTEYLKPGMCKAARSLGSSPNTSKVLFVTETPCSMSRAVSPKVNLIHPLREDKAGKKQGTAWCQWPAIILKVHPPKKNKNISWKTRSHPFSCMGGDTKHCLPTAAPSRSWLQPGAASPVQERRLTSLALWAAHATEGGSGGLINPQIHWGGE